MALKVSLLPRIYAETELLIPLRLNTWGLGAGETRQ